MEWDFSEALDTTVDEVFEGYRKAASEDPGEQERSEGDVEEAISKAGRVVKPSTNSHTWPTRRWNP